MAVIDLVRRVWQILYNLWCMCCLYAIAAVYVKLEIVRKLSTSSEIFRKLNTSSARRLNLDSDLPKDLTKFTIIMTGGSRGIGWEAAKVFLAKGAHVIITTSASGDRLSKLEAKLLSNCPHLDNPNKLQVRTMDLNSFESVGSFVAWFKSTGLDLNILINNAGQMYAPFRLTLDGYESHWQVNYLSHVLLVFLLLPILEKTSRQTGINSRIVNVASATHFARNLSLEDVNGLRLYSPYHSYAQSKLAQIMFTYKLASILSQGTCDGSDVSPITVNTLHPGVALTELYENVWWVKMFPAFAQCFFRTPADGAETVIYCALSPQLANTTGYYYEDLTKVASSSYSYNKLAQDALWTLTLEQLESAIEKYLTPDELAKWSFLNTGQLQCTPLASPQMDIRKDGMRMRVKEDKINDECVH